MESDSPTPRPGRRIVIVGGGFAGLATAFHLSREPGLNITVLEAAGRLGAHASGRNAGLVLQCSGNLRWRTLFRRTRSALESLPETSFRRTGSWQLGPSALVEALADPHVATTRLTASECQARQPLLLGAPFEAALVTPTDGVVDPRQLLAFYAREAARRGVDLRLGERVQSVEATSAVAPLRIETEPSETGAAVYEADVVVNAAGAWANGVAALLGLAPLPLTPFKRHLFHYEEDSMLSSLDQPFVWNQERHYYFRPIENGQWMYCLCDEEQTRDLRPTVSESIRRRSSAQRHRELPALAAATERRVWSCFRTKAADGDPVVGWDPTVSRLFWVAGLGGGGMSASWELGRWACELMMGRSLEAAGDPAEAISPRRFVAPATPAT